MTQELQKLPEQPLAVAPAPSVGQMLQAVIEKGVTAENVAAIEKLVGLYERMEDKRAEREFNTAYHHLRSILPPVDAVQPVPGRDGTVRYRFAPLEEIEKQIKPYLEQCGFSFSFREQVGDDKHKIEICRVMHIGGHSEDHPYSVRIGNGPPGCTETQADGSAGSYAKRYALCDAFGIVIKHQDQDARLEGGPITREQAEELAERVNLTNSDREKFLKLAGADTFFTIPAAKYDMLDDLLRRKERKGQ